MYERDRNHPVDPMSPVGSPIGNPFFLQNNNQGYPGNQYPVPYNQNGYFSWSQNPSTPLQSPMNFYPLPKDYVTREQLQQTRQEIVEQCLRDSANNTNTWIQGVLAETALLKQDTARLDRMMKAIQLDRTLAEDEAFSQIDSHGGRLSVIGRRGQIITLCDIPVDSLYHIIPDEAYGRDGYFLIQFKNREFVSIPEAYLTKPSKLLQKISEAAGKSIKTCSNDRRIAGLLVQYLAAAADRRPYLYRYGWLETTGGWQFWLCNGKTHCAKLPTNPDEFPHTMILTELDHGATLRSVEQVVTMFEVFLNPGHARVLFLWWNASFLYTLLAENSGVDSDSALPMGLCLLCHGKHPRHCMETIFRWYGDPVISLGDDADRFKRRLGQRKDQPLLIKDDVTSVQNEETLAQVLSSGSIPPMAWSDEPLDLRAAVTLLSEGKTPLCCNPNFLTLELLNQDLSPSILPKLPGLSKFKEDYFRGLAKFAQGNLDLLRNLIADMPAYDNAGHDQNYELSSNGAKVLAKLRCVRRFVQAYLEDLAPAEDLERRIQALLSEDDDFLLELLESSYTVNDNLTHVFLGITDRMLRDGSIPKVSIRKAVDSDADTNSPNGVVYFDDRYYYFDTNAFRAICRECHASTRTVLHSISPLLEGTPYCDSSAMTRVPGIRSRPRAYQISQKLFKRSFVKSKD